MKLKLINIIGILLTILIVGGILYPWSKNNVERFADPPAEPLAEDDSSAGANINQMQGKIKTVYQNLVETKLYANDFEDRVKALKEQIDKKGTVDGDDYIKLIVDIQNEMKKKISDKEPLGYKINNELQTDKIKELNDNIMLLFDKLKQLGFNIPGSEESQDTEIIKSIKSVHNGVNLNVKPLSQKILERSEYNSIKNNIHRNHPTIMIFLNNGCLKYDNNKDDKDKEKYVINSCELTNVNQYFVFKLINNEEELMDHLNGDYKKLQNNNPGNASQYPFGIVYPISNNKKCLKIDVDGISIEDCRPVSLNLDQRWISSPITKEACSVF
jgi:hypothetical protein